MVSTTATTEALLIGQLQALQAASGLGWWRIFSMHLGGRGGRKRWFWKCRAARFGSHDPNGATGLLCLCLVRVESTICLIVI